MSTAATVPFPQLFPKLEAKYNADREAIKDLRRQAAEAAAPILAEIAKLEQLQKNREDYLFEHGEIEAFGFVTALYLHGRDDKAEAKAKEADLGVNQKKMEEWLLKILSKAGNSIKTDFGTVYKTRKESVGVQDFEAYLESTIFAPIEEAVSKWAEADEDEPWTVEDLMSTIKQAFCIEAITKAANKTYVLERLGEMDEKTGARPNPPPPGIDYKAFATVGVRRNTRK